MNILDFVNIQTSTIEDGNMSYMYGTEEEVLQNKKCFWEKYGFEYDHTYQIKTNIQKFNSAKYLESTTQEFTVVEDTDALISHNPENLLALLTADCLAVVLFDPKTKMVALVHCGMKWEDAGILDATFEYFKKDSKPSDILVYLGCCIGRESYRWDSNIFNIISPNSFVSKNITKDTSDDSQYCYRIDLRNAVLQHLESLGIESTNIVDSKIDCYTDRRYFSHTRAINLQEQEGRHVTLVQVKN